MKTEYKGIEIMFKEQSMQFEAKVGDRTKRFPSVDAAKKAIDKEQEKKPFTPFNILRISLGFYGEGNVSEREIIGREYEGVGRNRRVVYLAKREKSDYHSPRYSPHDEVYKISDKQELVPIAKRIQELKKEIHELENKIEKKRVRLDELDKN